MWAPASAIFRAASAVADRPEASTRDAAPPCDALLDDILCWVLDAGVNVAILSSGEPGLRKLGVFEHVDGYKSVRSGPCVGDRVRRCTGMYLLGFKVPDDWSF